MVSNAEQEAAAVVKKRGFVSDEPQYQTALNLAFWFEIAKTMRPHISAWRAIDGGELPPCNQAMVAAFFDELEYADQVTLGLAYQEAVIALEKKSSPETSSEKDS